jgi:hypothetical protein
MNYWKKEKKISNRNDDGKTIASIDGPKYTRILKTHLTNNCIRRNYS